MSRSFAVVMVFGAMLTLGAAATAQPSSIDVLLRQGVELRQQHRDEEALTVFARALEVRREARVLAQVSQAEQALGRWVEAETHLREALADQRDPWITRNRAALEGALGVIEERLGSLTVSGEPSGAAVLVDGRTVGRLPMREPTRVIAGQMTIEVRAPGFASVVRPVRVEAGTTARETVTLTMERTSETTGPREQIPAPGTAATSIPGRAAESSPGSTQRALGWTALVIGLVGATAGVVGAVLREGAAQSYNDEVLSGSGNRCPGWQTQRHLQHLRCQEWLDQDYNGGIVRAVGLIGGGVLSLTGIILLATAPSRTARTSARMHFGAGPGDVGLSYGGSF